MAEPCPSSHPAVGRVGKVLGASLQGRNQQGRYRGRAQGPVQPTPSHGSRLLLTSCRCLKEDCPLLQPTPGTRLQCGQMSPSLRTPPAFPSQTGWMISQAWGLGLMEREVLEH